MQRFILLIITVCALASSIFFAHQHQIQTAGATMRNGCMDMPASPDYLSSNSAQDAIAAINNARTFEHLHPLRLPDHFYTMNPVQQQFILVNLERTDRGLRPLKLDANLSQVALAYSRQLRDLNFFAHTSPIGGTFDERVDSNPSIASHYSLAAENLAGNPVTGVGPIYEYMYHDAAEECGHRKNILDPDLTEVGINWVPGSIYGSISAQEFLASAPWNPYTGATPDTQAPHISILVQKTSHRSQLKCVAQTTDNVGVARITWFVDSKDKPASVGPVWMLNTSKLKPGKHTLYAYAVDGEQNYSMAQYIIRV